MEFAAWAAVSLRGHDVLNPSGYLGACFNFEKETRNVGGVWSGSAHTGSVEHQRPRAYIVRMPRLQAGHQFVAMRAPLDQRIFMTRPEDIYSDRLLALAAEMPRTERLGSPQATARAHSKLCGSTVEVDLTMEGDVVTAYGQTVRACLLGQTAASVVGREIVGSTAEELRALGATMRAMLKQGGPVPKGRWGDLALLESVRDYKARQPSTLLVFDADGRQPVL